MSARYWGLLLLAVAARCASLFLLRGDAYYRFAPRSLTSAAILVQPTWLDLAVPAVFILALFSPGAWRLPTAREIGAAVADALWILAFPIVAGLTLFLYWRRGLFAPVIDAGGALRWLQFVLAFVAINVFLDRVPVRNRWARRALAIVLGAALALTQDLMTGPNVDAFRMLILLASVGTLLAATAWALRRVYRQSPVRAVTAASLVGAVACFLAIALRSDALFTFFLPALALVAGAASLAAAGAWPRRIALACVAALGLFGSLGLPRFLSPQVRAAVSERNYAPEHTEAAGRLTISYDDPRVRDVTVRLARVLEAANDVSREAFGVSPEVRHLAIGGIAPGGFHAEFPDSIEGNLPSERAIAFLRDAALLNAPEFSVNEMDPVNAILHEYAHLYGVVPYMPWVMGAEEEGWATYAATRLSLKLWEKHGAALWDPPYDYARRARAITASNLRGHAVLWSHPDEFGGFRLWHALGERDGERALFGRRWEATHRAQLRFLLMFSDPRAARRLAERFAGPELEAAGKIPPVRFGDTVSREELVKFGESIGMAATDMKTRYDRNADRVFRPAVTVPRSRAALDASLAGLVLAMGMVVLRPRRSSLEAAVDEGAERECA